MRFRCRFIDKDQLYTAATRSNDKFVIAVQSSTRSLTRSEQRPRIANGVGERAGSRALDRAVAGGTDRFDPALLIAAIG